MREGGKKKIKKKNIDQIKKNIGHISGKVNVGNKIKKTFDLFKKKLMRTMKKTSKKNIAGKKNVSPEMNLFFLRNVFFISRNWLFFSRNRQQSNARAGHKKNMFIFGT